MADASQEQTNRLFQHIHAMASPEQWSQIINAMRSLMDEGVERLSVEDIIAIVESIVVTSEDGLTLEDLEGLR